ncbi:MAG: hypothetical protein R3A52_08080 [Polyangiales bacterium]
MDHRRSSGEVVRPSTEKDEPSANDSRPYVGLEHIESNTNRLVGPRIASDAKSSMAVFRKGDVLYSKLRPYLNKVTIAPFDGVGSTEILVFSRRPHIEKLFACPVSLAQGDGSDGE